MTASKYLDLSRKPAIAFEYIRGACLGGILGFVFTLIAIAVLSIGVEIVTGMNSKNHPVPNFALLITPFGILIGISRSYANIQEYGLKRKCPKCGRLYGETISKTKKEIEYSSSYTPTRRVDHYDTEGEFKGYSEIEGEPEYYTATRDVDELGLRCVCTHEWTIIDDAS